MIKHMHFLLSCSRKHKGVYITTSIAILSVFFMYLISVIVQNRHFHAGDMNTHSGLSAGYFQDMLVYLVNGMAILYFSIFIYKTPHNDGYELIVFSRKSTRLNILLSRIFMTIIFILFISLIEFALLSIPSQLDDVLESTEHTKWLLSTFTGMLIIGFILLFTFTFLTIIFNYLTSMILGATVLISFPLVSMMLYELSEPDTTELDKLERTELGVYQDGLLSLDDVMPNVEGYKIKYPNMQWKQSGVQIIDDYGQLYSPEGPSQLVYEYNKKIKYEPFIKVDGWNAFSNYLGLFNKSGNNNHYRSRDYSRRTIKDSIKTPIEHPLVINGYKIVKLNSHYEGDAGAWNVFIGYTSDSKEKNTAYMQALIRKVVNYFDANDSDANLYKGLPFNGQLKFWEYIINVWDESKYTIHDIIDSAAGYYIGIKNEPWAVDRNGTGFYSMWTNPLGSSYENIEKGYYLSKMMIDRNERRYKPSYVSYMGERTSVTGISHGDSEGYKNRIFETIDDNKSYLTVTDKEYDSTTPWTYILPIIATLLFMASLMVFMKKDIK